MQRLSEIWNKVVRSNAASGLYDHNGILEYEKALFQRLFQTNKNRNFGFNESVKSFLSWWDGVYGKTAIESVFDDERMNKIYTDMAKSIQASKDVTINRRLKINLVYDRPLLGGETAASWYSVLPIEDIYIRSNRQEVLSHLLKSCHIH
ncbi:hypothetical protein LIT25_18425 [Bacillus sp. F19]|nr:hypothetical protein LIT25_18425 [Bacillus sp. F19]